ncbi:MAG TPA: ABC transporter permease subunit [Flavipsychrobacter sp.]|nr:ABC transporter permease subunit [Flavipsychrobacter sp.]
MKQLVQQELYKIFRRPRTYISFGIIAAVTLIVEAALYADGKTFIDFALASLTEQFDIQGNIINGYLVTYIILQSLIVNIPLLVALVAGDALAGEANIGTLRLLLTKPITRSKLVWAKFLASVVYTLLLLLWLAIISLGLSLIIFGTGDMVNMKSDAMVLILKDDVPWRYFAAFGFAAIAMTAVAALSVLLSVFAENSIGPIVSTMGIILFFTIITNLGLPSFEVIKPYLMTTHMIAWKGFFSDPVPFGAIAFSGFVLMVYTVVFIASTIIIFNKKDIKS